MIQSTLLVSRLPLFDALLSLGGDDMTTLRALTGTLGVLCAGLLYVFTRRARGNAWFALISAAAYALYPLAILCSRWGFSYNWLALLVVLFSWGAWEYLAASQRKNRRGWLALAALALGLGCVSDLWMLVLIVPLLLLAIRREWRDVLWSLALALLPLAVYALWMFSRAPDAFLFDVRFVAFRVSRLSLAAQLGAGERGRRARDVARGHGLAAGIPRGRD